eukprot:COSAG01_NODE_8624_length_2716_cov_2.982423_3_plen_82_part_00
MDLVKSFDFACRQASTPVCDFGGLERKHVDSAQQDVGKITAQNTHLTTASPTQPPHGESARHPALHSCPTPSRHEPAYVQG